MLWFCFVFLVREAKSFFNDKFNTKNTFLKQIVSFNFPKNEHFPKESNFCETSERNF